MNSKELAKLLNLSPSAVSLALNGKPGVSTKTRNRVLEAAQKYGMDLTAKQFQTPKNAPIYFIYYRKHGAVLADTAFFSELSAGVEKRGIAAGYSVIILNIYTFQTLQQQLTELENIGVAGAIILATEMQDEDFMYLAFLKMPVVLLDNHFISSKISSVQINNIDGAFQAVNYLIKKKHTLPGYLHSMYDIYNFEQRKEGFMRAVTYNGMSKSSVLIHELTPSLDGAFADMNALIDSGEPLASCYFADNDLIAIGAMRALKEHGYRIPEDIGIIGFDDIAMCDYTAPGLSTVHVPKQYLGSQAVDRLLELIDNPISYPVNVQVSTNLVIRGSI